MKVKENQKTLISGRNPLFDLPETPILKGKIRVNHETGEPETVYNAGFSKNLLMLFCENPDNLPENEGGEN